MKINRNSDSLTENYFTLGHPNWTYRKKDSSADLCINDNPTKWKKCTLYFDNFTLSLVGLIEK